MDKPSPETFPQSESGKDVSVREVVDPVIRGQIEEALDSGIGVRTLIGEFGGKAVEAAFTSPDFVERVENA